VSGKRKIYKNYLFDLDQTLLDFHASEKIGLEKVLHANGLSFSDDIYSAFKAYNKSLWTELEKGTISREELFIKRFVYIFEKCEGDSFGLDPLSVNNDFIVTMSQNGVLMDGALDLVKRIKEEIEDSKIYVVSNGATINANGRIASTGLGKYLDGVFVSEDMGVNKPAKEYFDIVLDKIGQPKESCIVIGDSLSSDMLGAKNASMDSIWFMPAGDIESAVKEYNIKYTADSFNEIFEALKDWNDTLEFLEKGSINNYKAFFVDFYGTIVHEDGEVIKKITKIICETGKVENPSDVGTFWWKDFQTMFMNSHESTFETQRVLEEKSLVHTLERFGSDADAKELSNMMFAHWVKPPIFEDSKEFFEKSPLPVYIVSNIDTSDVLQAIAFHDLHPAGVFTSEDAKGYKPGKELFELALKSTGYKPNEVIHIGDSVSSDVQGAAKVGVKALWLNRFGKDVPDGVESISGLLEALDRLKMY
jgi:YjjG family noncanonical pyrimidine nucleotidase